MLLGKRPRPPMRRTTSMTEFSLDLEAPEPSDPQQQQEHQGNDLLPRGHVASSGVAAMLSPRNNFRRSSADFRAVETAPFLRACGLCKRRLGPGRDIYMYRGEVAFCSLECRQQLINQEEIKEKCALSTIKTDSHAAAVAAGSETPGGNNGETVAAA